MRFAFSRLNGDYGSIAVKVKTQSSTAMVGTSEENGDLKYTNKILKWADGDTADKYIDVPVYASGVGKTFRFKLSTLATGAHESNVVPELEQAKIYVPIVEYGREDLLHEGESEIVKGDSNGRDARCPSGETPVVPVARRGSNGRDARCSSGETPVVPVAGQTRISFAARFDWQGYF